MNSFWSKSKLIENPRRGGSVPRMSGAEEAYRGISSWEGYRPTPLHRLRALARERGVAEVYYKDESHRFGLGSFKALGGPYAISRLCEPGARLTVATATDGNHGRAVAWGAQRFGCDAVVFVPRNCSRYRELAIAGYGATVRRIDGNYDEAVRQCAREAAANGWTLVSDTSWPGYEEIPAMVMAGYTVMGREILDELPPDLWPTHVFVQAGVGAMAAALLSYFDEALQERRPKFIVVEPEGAACLYASAVAGRPTVVSDIATVMSGLECGEVSYLAWQILDAGADWFATVSDDVVPDCMRMLRPITAGDSAVAGLAAFLSVDVGLDEKSRVLLVGSEGATDPELYERLSGCMIGQ